MEFKESCLRCDGPLGWIDEAWVCSSECTYCADCKDEVGGVCPNCSEMLRRREKRTQPVGRARPSAGPAAEPFK